MTEKTQEKLAAIEGFELRQYLDGAKLYAWLEDKYPELMEGRHQRYDDAIIRRLYDWKVTTHPVSYVSADRILIRMGIHIDQDVPDYCWLPIADYFSHRDADTRERALDLLDEGMKPSAVGKELGITARKVRRYRREYEFQQAAERQWYTGRLEDAGLTLEPGGRAVAA